MRPGRNIRQLASLVIQVVEIRGAVPEYGDRPVRDVWRKQTAKRSISGDCPGHGENGGNFVDVVGDAGGLHRQSGGEQGRKCDTEAFHLLPE